MVTWAASGALAAACPALMRTIFMHVCRQDCSASPMYPSAQKGSKFHLESLRCCAKSSRQPMSNSLQKGKAHPAGPGTVCCLRKTGAGQPSGQAARPMRHQDSMAASWRGPDEILAPLDHQCSQVADSCDSVGGLSQESKCGGHPCLTCEQAAVFCVGCFSSS